MTFQEKIQDAVNSLVEETKVNYEKTREQVVDSYNKAVAELKDEYEAQKVSFSSYKERLTNKNFEVKNLPNAVKEEVEFFSNELKTVVNRNVERAKKVMSAPVADVKATVEKVKKTATKKVEKVADKVEA